MIWACDCDLTETLWHHRDPAVTPLWLHCDSVLTPLWPPNDNTVRWKPIKSFWLPESGHAHSDLRPNQEIRLSYWGWSPHWAVWSAREHVSRRSLMRAHILSAFPPWLLLERPSSTCDLHHTWPVSSQLPQPFDHILMSHVTTPCLGGRIEPARCPVDRHTCTRTVCVCVHVSMFVCVCQVDRWENGSCDLLLTLWPFTLWSVWLRSLPW